MKNILAKKCMYLQIILFNLYISLVKQKLFNIFVARLNKTKYVNHRIQLRSTQLK